MKGRLVKRFLLVLGLAFGLHTATASAATAPMLTLFADRAQLAEADCTTKQARPGAVPLGQVIQDMDSRGLAGTFGVVTKFINPSTHRCANPALYPSWDELAAWHQQYGWEATSNGKTKLVLTTATDQQLQDETCGSLPLFTSHGFQRAWGMFSYPNDQFDARTQATVLSCFSFGRDYANAVNTQPGSNGYAYVKQLRGGDSATFNGPGPQKYSPPSEIAPYTHPRAGQWRVVQFYRFVTGSQPGMWDCTGPPADHWTWKTETYCYTDWLTLLDQITIPTTDPATVAAAWGRAR
jgi:hypothetical protein